MASKVPPVKNAAYSFSVFLFAQADNQILTAPTIAAGDFQVSKDSGSFANLATLPAETPASSGQVLVSLSASEMNADEVTVRWKDASGDEWHSAAIIIHTIASGQQFDNLATSSDLAVVDGIVDAILTDTDVTIPALIAALNNLSASDVWSYVSRTLTQAAASVVSAVQGSEVSVYRGARWSISLTGLGDLTSYDTGVYFSVKRRLQDSDDDAILRVFNNASGLERVNKEVPTSATNGTVTIDDAAAGDITITVEAVETQNMPLLESIYYDVKGIASDGTVDLLASGNKKFNILGDVTNKVS